MGNVGILNKKYRRLSDIDDFRNHLEKINKINGNNKEPVLVNDMAWFVNKSTCLVAKLPLGLTHGKNWIKVANSEFNQNGELYFDTSTNTIKAKHSGFTETEIRIFRNNAEKTNFLNSRPVMQRVIHCSDNCGNKWTDVVWY